MFKPILDNIFAKYNMPKLRRVDTDNGRRYEIKPVLDNEKLRSYISATSFLNEISDNDWVDNWHNRIGKEAANNIINRATAFGTAMHDTIECRIIENTSYSSTYNILEDHLNETNSNDINLLSEQCDTAVDTMMTVISSKFKSISAMENFVFSDKFQISGAFDALGISIDNKCTIIDFKNSRSMKNEKYIENYFFQVFIYAMALREMLYKYVRPYTESDSEWESIKAELCPTHFMIIVYNRAETGQFAEPHAQVFSGKLSEITSKFLRAYNRWTLTNTTVPF